MADFKSSFEKGIAAHAAGEQAKAEIWSVLDDVSHQIREATSDRITVTREVLTRRADNSAILGPFQPLVNYSALVARLADKQKSSETKEELCEFQISPYGYPVTLIYGSQEIKCYDRQGLEIGLMRLLEHPDTGGQLRRLLNLQVPSTSSDTKALPPTNDSDVGVPSE